MARRRAGVCGDFYPADNSELTGRVLFVQYECRYTVNRQDKKIPDSGREYGVAEYACVIHIAEIRLCADCSVYHEYMPFMCDCYRTIVTDEEADTRVLSVEFRQSRIYTVTDSRYGLHRTLHTL